MLNIVLSEIDALVVVNKIIKLLNQHIKINQNVRRHSKLSHLSVRGWLVITDFSYIQFSVGLHFLQTSARWVLFL